MSKHSKVFTDSAQLRSRNWPPLLQPAAMLENAASCKTGEANGGGMRPGRRRRTTAGRGAWLALLHNRT